MADYSGDREYQEKIETLLFNVKYGPAARAIQAAGRIGDLGLPDKQLLVELTILSQETRDNLVRDAILEAQERVGRKTILPVYDEKEQTPDAIPSATQEIETEIPLENTMKDQTIKCPFCVESIKKEAVVCRHCGWLVANRKPCPSCGRNIPSNLDKCSICEPYSWWKRREENVLLTELTASELGYSLRRVLGISGSVCGGIIAAWILRWFFQALFGFK